MTYIPGDFWRICDRCGTKTRSSQTLRTWDGLFVCYADFETRHPQDFVRGRVDNQNVPDARPESVDNIIGPLTTAISAAAAVAATTFSVDSSARFLTGDTINIFLDDGSSDPHTILSVPSATSIQISTPLKGAASVGNIVINYSAVAVADIG